MADINLKHDVRSIDRDFKRGRDLASKWSNGARPSPGCYLYLTSMTVCGGGSDGQRHKVRPQQKKRATRFREEWQSSAGLSEAINEAHDYAPGPSPNVGRRASSSLELGQASKQGHDGPFETNATTTLSGVPLQPIALDVFVKTPGQETEKLVRKEYEILDSEDKALKGRKARETLRGRPVVTDLTQTIIEHDFELV
jgi:hypothetical protein